MAMRALPLLLALAVAVAWPAGAQQSGLRGPLSAVAAPPAAQAPSPALPALLAPLAPISSAETDRCRLNCASGYYFCLSTETAEDCAPNWMQCRAACDAPTRRQVITANPGRP